MPVLKYRKSSFALMLILVRIMSGCGHEPAPRIVAYGDSVTWGYGGLPLGWVGRIELNSGYKIANLAIPGEKSKGGAQRIRSALLTQPQSEVVLLLHGGNDWTKIVRQTNCRQHCDPSEVNDDYLKIGDNLRAMADISKALGKRVVFATYWHSAPEKCQDFYKHNFPNSQVHLDRLNEEIIKIAAEKNSPVIRLDDLTNLPTDPDNYFDCLHPAPAGYEKIAHRWMEELDVWQPTSIDAEIKNFDFPTTEPIEDLLGNRFKS